MIIELFKTLDPVDENILLKKLETNGNVDKNLQWLKNYLNDKKHYIQLNSEEKSKSTVSEMWCATGVYARIFSFLIYINDIQFVSDVLDHIYHVC